MGRKRRTLTYFLFAPLILIYFCFRVLTLTAQIDFYSINCLIVNSLTRNNEHRHDLASKRRPRAGAGRRRAGCSAARRDRAERSFVFGERADRRRGRVATDAAKRAAACDRRSRRRRREHLHDVGDQSSARFRVYKRAIRACARLSRLHSLSSCARALVGSNNASEPTIKRRSGAVDRARWRSKPTSLILRRRRSSQRRDERQVARRCSAHIQRCSQQRQRRLQPRSTDGVDCESRARRVDARDAANCVLVRARPRASSE